MPRSINEPDAPNIEIPETMPPDEVIEEPDSPPAITALVPDHAAVGDPVFQLRIDGTGFTAESVVSFAGVERTTAFDDTDGSLSIEVDPSFWTDPATVPVEVANGNAVSNVVDFTFGPAAGG